LRIGLTPPGTIEKSTLKVSHPALPDEKSGGDGFSTANAVAENIPQAKPARAAESMFAGEGNLGMVSLLCMVTSTPERTSCPRIR
jgi:hypothetical protein